MITTYRDHGHMLACGMDPKGVMAELTGRRGGYSKGKGGSMHMFSKEKNFYGGHGIVGANVPLGAGIAFANRYQGNGAVCLTYFGDGAANQGQVYESFNMAKLWKLPVVFVIENNKYAMGTSVERSAATTDFSQRGRSFDIPGEQVDGMDVRAVKAVGDRVFKWVREGNGPYILEMLTYRYRGHSMSDPGKYRSREEIQKMREEHDPIEQVRRRLLEGRLVSEDDLKKIDAEIRAIVVGAAEFAQNDAEPDESELFDRRAAAGIGARADAPATFIPISTRSSAPSPSCGRRAWWRWPTAQYVKVAKVKGEFVWHAHAEEDEFFLVRKGTLMIRYATGPMSRCARAISMSCRVASST